MKLRILVALFAVFVATGFALGQTTAPAPAPAAACTPSGFAVSSDAVAVEDPTGAFSAGTVIKQGFDAFDFGTGKCNRLFVEGTQGVMPGISTNFYGGGVAIQPNLASLFKSTNIPTDKFNVLLDGGVGLLTVATGPAVVGGYGGGVLKYNFSNTVTWNSLRVEMFLAGGKLYKTYSTGLTAYFGK